MADTDQVVRRSAQTIPRATQDGSGGAIGYPNGSYGPDGQQDWALFSIAQFADDISPWGVNIRLRDLQLRQFLPQQPLLLSAFGTVAVRNAAFAWSFDGGKVKVARAQRLLQEANLGGGWRKFIIKLTIDLLSQDNGAFVEVVRATESPNAEVIGLLNMDAGRCWRTGDPRNPVLYTALDGTYHLLPWWRVLVIEEMPSNIERLRGLQYCALTRVLQTAQIYRDIAQFTREKMGGNDPSQIHLVGGVAPNAVQDVLARAKAESENQGLYRFMQPLIVTGIKPGENPSVATINLKGLPDGFDAQAEFVRYVQTLAMGLFIDQQDLLPLSGGNIGTSTQSRVLAEKSRGKGPALFQKIIEDTFNFYGIFGSGVTFAFAEQDLTQEREEAEAKKLRAEYRKLWYDMGMPATVIWQEMADQGDITEELLVLMGSADMTDDVTATDEEPVANQDNVDNEAAAAVRNEQTTAIVEANPLANIRASKTPQHRAMDETEEAARQTFEDAMAKARNGFARAIARGATRESPVVAEVKALVDDARRVVAEQVEAQQAHVAEAKESLEATVLKAAAAQAQAQQESARMHSQAMQQVALAVREAARPKRRRPVRDDRGVIVETVEETI